MAADNQLITKQKLIKKQSISVRDPNMLKLQTITFFCNFVCAGMGQLAVQDHAHGPYAGPFVQFWASGKASGRAKFSKM